MIWYKTNTVFETNEPLKFLAANMKMNLISFFSASLNQLDGDDSDDSYHDAKEDNISSNRQNPLDMDAISISPSESGCSSPFCKNFRF